MDPRIFEYQTIIQGLRRLLKYTKYEALEGPKGQQLFMKIKDIVEESDERIQENM